MTASLVLATVGIVADRAMGYGLMYPTTSATHLQRLRDPDVRQSQ